MKPLERHYHSNIDTKTQSGDTGSRWLRSNSPLAPQPYGGLSRRVLSPWVLDLPSSQNVALVNAAAASMMVSATGLSSFPPPFILRYPATAQYPTCFHPSRSDSVFLRARQNLTLRLRPSLSNSPHHPLRYSSLLSRRLVCISGRRFLAEVLRSRFSVY
jgi:hypothetical protein